MAKQTYNRAIVRLSAPAKKRVNETAVQCKINANELVRCSIVLYSAALTRHLCGDTFVEREHGHFASLNNQDKPKDSGDTRLRSEKANFAPLLSLPVPTGRNSMPKNNHEDTEEKSQKGETINFTLRPVEVECLERTITALKRATSPSFADAINDSMVIRAGLRFFDLVVDVVLNHRQEVFTSDDDAFESLFVHDDSLRDLCAASKAKDVPLHYHPPGCAPAPQPVTRLPFGEDISNSKNYFPMLLKLEKRREELCQRGEASKAFEADVLDLVETCLESAQKMDAAGVRFELGFVEVVLRGEWLLYALSNPLCLLPGMPVVTLDKSAQSALVDPNLYAVKYAEITSSVVQGLVKRSPLHSLLTSPLVKRNEGANC